MASYTFHSLSDADFEDLVCDLLSAEFGVEFQSFTKGRDAGIDLLHGARMADSTVVQCKHYCRSKFAGLKSNIKTKELPKIRKLNPARYILTTSVSLTPQNKEELLALLSPYCQGINDIYGLDDICSLLRKNPNVEMAHYKLWLTSTSVLQKVLRHGSAVWKAMSKADIERQMSLYVQTDAFGTAMNTLLKFNYCILSGIPGIGKTTLAQVLIAKWMDDGYELIAVNESVEEAFEEFESSRRQIIYYDDFLGQSSIGERLVKNEDQRIVRLLNEARRSDRLKVILTTREYILEDAKRTYEPLSRIDLDMAKCVVKMEDYTRGHKARILYNHVFFSGLSQAYLRALLQNKAYQRILDHEGYNPRIVEWMTLGAGAVSVPPEAYIERFIQVMDDPTQVWQHAFDRHIGADARAILFLLGSTEGWFGLDELRAEWAYFQGYPMQSGNTIEVKRLFNQALRQLEGTFTRTTMSQDETIITFHNPSIKDYVRRRIVDDRDVCAALLRAALHFEQVSCLVRLKQDGTVDAHLTRMIDCDQFLEDALKRTLSARSAGYHLVHFGSDSDKTYFVRTKTDIGERLSHIFQWAIDYASVRLRSLACDLAAEFVASNDLNRAATLSSCRFLSSVLGVYPNGEQNHRIVWPFLKSIDEELSAMSPIEDWLEWTRFMKSSRSIFDPDEIEAWVARVREFCVEEVDVAIENAETVPALEQWYDQIVELAKRWEIEISEMPARIQERLEDLISREDRVSRSEDWAEPETHNAKLDSDAEIDKLFGSLEVSDLRNTPLE